MEFEAQLIRGISEVKVVLELCIFALFKGNQYNSNAHAV
jgi:hypothetical protein